MKSRNSKSSRKQGHFHLFLKFYPRRNVAFRLGQLPPREAVAQFRRMTATMLVELETKIGSRGSQLKLEHPWFGPFTARQWYWLLGQHGVIHYLQVKRIKERL